MDVAGIRYKLINKGLWSHRDKLKFKSAGCGSAFSDLGDSIVEVDNIDSLKDITPTFIKMDVEGSEYQALVGAKNTIRRSHPRLAICVYHKLEDIWEIPLLIQSIDPDYVFYLRHYSFADNETVLYAI